MRRWLIALAALLCAGSAVAQAPPGVDQRAILAERPPELLSAYHFFRDAGARQPNQNVTPYDLNTTLYSDGALKFRYVYMPPDRSAIYNPDTVFDFPVGAVLIKTFAFAPDMRHHWFPGSGIDFTMTHERFLETRLLIRRADGWVALAYVWNEAQTEARLSPIGATVPVDFMNEAGEPTHLDWMVPNRNQCKGCHDRNGEIVPIGPTARNLNRDYAYPSGPPDNQIDYWAAYGPLMGSAETPNPNGRDAPHMPNAFDPSAPLDLRARAYLDVNCAHCHNPQGPAHTSGLDLRWSQHTPIAFGVNKRPVAAGRGSANMQFAIAPGDPDHSFLIYRMQSLDPGVMMPELARQTVDERAVALMREWVSHMNTDGSQAP